MRTAGMLCVVVVLALIVGCSSEEPEAEAPLTAADMASMPQISMAEVEAKLRKPDGKALLLLLWNAETEEKTPSLKAVDDLATRHANEGLEVLALNIDMPDDFRDKALPLVAKLGLTTVKPRTYQDDAMGLGSTIDYLWGGQTPLVALYDAKGTQVFKAYGEDPLAQLADQVAAALAKR